MLVGRTAELDRIEAFLGAVERRARDAAARGRARDGQDRAVAGGARARARTACWRAGRSRRRPSSPTPRWATCSRELDDEELAALPAPQRHALEVALLRAEPGEHGAPQRAVALGLLAVLRARPTIVAVDDVQWLDHPSEVVLGFVARRLEGARVGLLVARRGGGAMPLHLPESARVDGRPAGARRAGAAADRDARADLARRSSTRVHARSRRQPVLRARAARLPRGAVDAARPRRGPAGGAVAGRAARRPRWPRPVAARRRPWWKRRAAPVPEVLATTRRRAGALRRIRCCAEVAYEQVADKRALHARAAALVDDPEERARHLALAADEPDEEVAAALVEAARRARARGAPDAAAELLEQARRLQPGASWRRAVEAAERHLEAGDAERAQDACSRRSCPRSRPGASGRTRSRGSGGCGRTARGFAPPPRSSGARSPSPAIDVALRIEIETGLSWCTQSSTPSARRRSTRARRSRWPRSSATRRCSRARSRTSRSSSR